MARTGRRMMPTFPSPPLKFRTVSFPQYGFKASLSDPAFPDRQEVKPTPGIPSGLSGFTRVLRVRAGTRPTTRSSISPAGQSGQGPLRPHAAAPQGSLAPDRVLLSRSLLAYYDPIRQSRRHAATSRCLAYTPRLRCAGAPRRPARPSLLSLSCFPHVPPTLPRWVRRPLPLVLGAAIPGSLELSASRHPPPRLCQPSPTGKPFEAASFASCCGPCVCPALLAGYDESALARPPSEVPCHSRFWHHPSPGSAGSQARWANGKSPIVGTFTRPVTTGSEAARRVGQWRGPGVE